MLTYNKTVETEGNRLEIKVQYDPESPRTWSNIGFFVTHERDYCSPDGTENKYHEAMMETSGDAKNSEDHMERIKKMLPEVKFIFPITRYEHSSKTYYRGLGNGFDDSRCGFYMVTQESQDVLGTPDELVEKVVDDELKIYTKYANGEVYGYILYDEKGEQIDSCWGFFNIEDIRDSLPEEFIKEDLSDYLV